MTWKYTVLFLTLTEEKNKFELYKFPDEEAGGISYTKIRDEIEKDLDISDITATDLQEDIIGTLNIQEYSEQVTKRMEDVGYMNILSGYPRSLIQDFESYLRTEIDLVEDDIRLFLHKYNSSFNTYELDPGIYTFKDLSEALLNFLHFEYPESSSEIDIEYDEITKKTKLVVNSGIIALKLNEKTFLALSLVLLQDGIVNTLIKH